jgi:hypothetical protein
MTGSARRGKTSESRSRRGRSAFGPLPKAGLAAEQIHRFILGIDPRPRPMTVNEAAKELSDPFAVLLLRKGKFPRTHLEILAGIDDATKEGHPLRRQMTFIVGEGSQIPFSPATASVDRGLRLAITRGRDNEVDVLISTAASGAVASRFLQVMGWDEKNGFFHFYERKDGIWIWAGNSTHALDPRSRGKGPFDSHVNGSMVMKELKAPWTHWQSVDATVPPEVFPPNDPTRKDPFFTGKSGAEVFETRVVRPGVRRWTDRRFDLTTAPDGTMTQVDRLMEQLFVTTTVNLVSSFLQSRNVRAQDQLDLPSTFYVDADTLGDLGLPTPFVSVKGKFYLDALQKFDVSLRDGTFRQSGDTHFAFLVPERAFEDIDVVKKCLEQKLVTERFVGCALMVDFANPVFSAKRAHLLGYAPDAFRGSGSRTLTRQIVENIEAAAGKTGKGSPEKQFLALWKLGNGWRDEASKQLRRYYKAIERTLGTESGFQQIFRLAESRRREVRGLQLSEGRPLLFARSNIPEDAPLLEMKPDGIVGEKA